MASSTTNWHSEPLMGVTPLMMMITKGGLVLLVYVHFPFTLSVIGTLSIRLRDLTMSFVVSAYFLK